MGKTVVRRFFLICFVLGSIIALTGCAAPIFRSDAERYAENPEVITALEPYLDSWATTPHEETLRERKRLTEQIDDVLLIDLISADKANGEKFYIVAIRLDAWADWSRGYLYIHDGSELPEMSRTTVKKISDKFYIYNRNE